MNLHDSNETIRNGAVSSDGHLQQTLHESVVSHALFVCSCLKRDLAAVAMKRVYNLRVDIIANPCSGCLDNSITRYLHKIAVLYPEFFGLDGVYPQFVFRLNLIEVDIIESGSLGMGRDFACYQPVVPVGRGRRRTSRLS